ncbi:hypothetical protein SAMN04487950_3489 [Halogranum rubrum]|uniref:Uncharacterized protein n=1 Tax=Halogranum rubrum TaxID=553466 RepID=A0A1I4GYC0_9EURY|nr:hypothetical protein [Halogranum rubrum]SFL34949.1 hypothetical protein SAMN04487950_3489 [Halogranum rubrum]
MSFGDALRAQDETRRATGIGPTDDERAKTLAEATARELRTTYGTDDVSELAAAVGVTVRHSEWDGVDGLYLFGTYADSVITLYDSQLPHLAERLGITASLAADLVLAHELGHHALDGHEEATPGRPTLRQRLLSWVAGSGHRAFEERAAHWFALELVGDKLPKDARAVLR